MLEPKSGDGGNRTHGGFLSKMPPFGVRTKMGFVYFIQEAPRGPIKIGWANSKVGVKRRFDNLRVGNPRELVLRGFTKGAHAFEQHLHWHFADDHARGEWFWPSPPLELLVTVVEARTFGKPLDDETKEDYADFCADVLDRARGTGIYEGGDDE